MRIAVISDQHLGYGWDTERHDDSFDNCREAFEKAKDADLILIPGDLFDRKIPRQEVLGRAIDLFKLFEERDPGVRLIDGKQHEFRGTPIVAIHGTHERRGKNTTNPVQLLEKAGFLVHLHNENVVFQKGNETVAVHGMSGVPERYAPQVLQRFDPQPVEDAFNVLLLHQSIEKFVYTDKDQSVLKLEHMPDGFDYIVNGHIHWKNLKLKNADKPLLIPGSIITTQMNKVEAEQPKGFLWINTETGNVEFEQLESPRQVLHREIEVTDMSGSQVRQVFKKTLEQLLADTADKKPLVRINLTGKTEADISITELKHEFEDQAVLNVSKKTYSSSQPPAEIENEETALETGMEILREKTDSQLTDQLFQLLEEGKLDEAMERLDELDIKDLPGQGENDGAEEVKQQLNKKTGNLGSFLGEEQ